MADDTLIEAVLGGQRDLFAVIMRRYNQRLFRVARAIVGGDAEAQDIVQHAYVAAYAHLGQFAGDAAFSTWLTRIVINEALSRTRDAGRFRQLEIEEQDRTTSGVSTPEDDTTRREVAALLEGAIDELPEAYRVVLVLRDLEELSTTDVAVCLSVSEETVRTRLHRARALLRDDIANRLGDVGPDVFHFAGDRCARIVRNVFARLNLALPQRIGA